jgi:hypothetical protein
MCVHIDKYISLHGIFQFVPFISPSSWYQVLNRYIYMICLSYTSTEEITDLYHILSTFNIIREKIAVNNFLCKYSIKEFNQRLT